MSLLSADVGAHAPGHKLEHRGRTFEFRHLTIRELAEFERENYRGRREALRELKEDYGPQEYVKRLDELRERYDRHEFALESDEGFRKTAGGVMLVLRLMLRCDEAEAWDLFQAQTVEVTRLMELVVRESFPHAAAAQADEKKTPG
jgi:hypothetical protein